MKTLVLGGTGFLGRRLVERLDRQVITLSRHAPATLLPNETHVALDIFNAPALKKEMLEEVDSIVHCLGAVSPLPYKNLKFSSNRTVEWSDLMKINFVVLMGVAAELKHLKSIVYVSTSPSLVPFPFNYLLRGYQESKASAEHFLTSQPHPARRIIVRPGLIYDENPVTLPISAIFTVMNHFKTEILPTSISSLLPPPPSKPIHVNTLCDAIIHVLDGEEGSHIYDNEDLHRLGNAKRN